MENLLPMSAAVSSNHVDLTTGVRVLARLARVAEQSCQATGISLPQYRLLACVADGPQRASALAELVGVSRPTLTSLVDGLEQAGFLRRRPVPTDRRGIELEATPAGLDAVARADVALSDRLVELVGEDRAAAWVNLARRIGESLLPRSR